MRPKIKFSHNWNNKLNQPYFTTIRRYTHDKYEYYLYNLKNKFDVILNDKKVAVAQLINIDIMELKDIPDGLLIVDTGKEEPREFFYDEFSIYPRTEVLILTFKRIKGK